MEQQVSEFLEHLAKNQGRSANTIAAYRNDLTQFVEYLQQVANPPIGAWTELRLDVLHAFFAFLKNHKREYTSATMARRTAAVKRFCHYLYTTGQVEYNYGEELHLPKVTKNPPPALNAEDVMKLLGAPAGQNSPKALRDRALLETLYASGMRVTELVDLDLDNVKLAAKVAYCGEGGKRGRAVKLSEQAVSALHAYLQEGRCHLVIDRNEAALFLNHRGRRLTRQGLWLIIKRYVKQAGIKTPVTPHTLRHSFAAHLLNAGVALHDIKERLGYAQLSSTQVFQQVANGLATELVIDGKPVVNPNGVKPYLNGQ